MSGGNVQSLVRPGRPCMVEGASSLEENFYAMNGRTDTSLVKHPTTGTVVGAIANLGDDPARSP